ncbi:type II toxin-antitoxin system VapB family antitoxin [Aeromonas caviae]|uniref:type II toxin-antitoxin system VapB family antitoxin n=1 Tax=Aeromonas caviae TaxID=648 RepID=UPI002B47F013|nr:type II toxin-antitoxin system VapB family antitoxin [Aeromonas caviae]
MSDEPSCSNVLDPQLPRCAWLLACSVSRKDASPQSSASARRIPVRILSGNGVHRFRNHCSTSPEYARVMESTVFRCGRGQGVYLPEAVALPDEVTHVEIVVVGRTRIITPVGESWDRWFDEPCMSTDFMAEREQPTAQEREKL